MNDIKRWSIAELRYAGGAEHDVKYVSEVDYEAVSAELEAVKASFDELASLVGFSEDRLKQTGDSPMDCARQLIGRTRCNGDFDQSALAAVLQAELDQPERPAMVAVPRHVPSDLIACIHLEWDGRAGSLWPLLLERITETDPYL